MLSKPIGKTQTGGWGSIASIPQSSVATNDHVYSGSGGKKLSRTTCSALLLLPKECCSCSSREPCMLVLNTCAIGTAGNCRYPSLRNSDTAASLLRQLVLHAVCWSQRNKVHCIHSVTRHCNCDTDNVVTYQMSNCYPQSNPDTLKLSSLHIYMCFIATV